MEVIKIVLICDMNYVVGTCATINSIKKNKNSDSKINIHIMACELDEDSKKKLAEKSEENFNVFIHTIENNKFNEIGQDNFYVSKAALIKFDLANILQDLDKVIYMDGDILVLHDLHELWETDIQHVYCAAVSDMPSILGNAWNKKLGLSNYFNSGVMLLNLKKIREDNMVGCLIEAKKNDQNKRYMDQDAFNVAFGENVKYISLKYNMIVSEIQHFQKSEICKTYQITEQELNDIIQDPTIIHYASIMKPWKDLQTEKIELWYDYVDRKDLPYCISNYIYAENEIVLDLNRRMTEKVEGVEHWVSTVQEQVNEIRNSKVFIISEFVASIPRRIKNKMRGESH